VFDDLDELFKISKRWPAEQRLLAGERGGEKLEGFDPRQLAGGMQAGAGRRQAAVHELPPTAPAPWSGCSGFRSC